MAKAPKKAQLDATFDIPDYRDRWYEPSLAPLARSIAPPGELVILDQGQEGACTGFGLAAVINFLNRQQQPTVPDADLLVSPRMIYEMARLHDEWPGENYEGSSCRGAIKGWYHMGVCRDRLWPYDPKKVGHLTVERAKDARSQTIGAYYRVRKNIVEMHAALNEVGVLYVSADVHAGWWPENVKKGLIKKQKKIEGGHAFALVGYDERGFWVQNSWGPDWGKKGVALWTYEDWIENAGDAWVVQLALPTPQLYSRRSEVEGSAHDEKAALQILGPRRDEVAGHFVHIDDGRFHEHGRYWSKLEDVRETAAYVAASDKYDHLLIYAHGGLNSVEASASRIAAMKKVFKPNRIYPFHFMYDTGLLEEMKDVVFGKRSEAEERAGGISDWTDRIIERATRRPGRALWREMKSDARACFSSTTEPGSQVLRAFVEAFAQPGAQPKKIHLVGHSTGGILLGHLLQSLAQLARPPRVASMSLLAPAATVALFRELILPLVKKSAFGVDQLDVYNLNEKLELDDEVGKVYRKSLLYLVSRAFEEVTPEAILGMQLYSKDLEALKPEQIAFHYSDGRTGGGRKTSSTSHGGFDNDPATMNSILARVLGKKPARPFTKEDLKY
ncbi:MAG: peptidase C1 [Planctomycetes bacterium]|nr:peptidase C1 [Planctomycetota bacterium]